jgi:ankyrin repeat protein
LNCKLFLFFTLISLGVFGQEISIYDIARNGGVEELKSFLIKEPKSLNIANDKGYFPLTIACYHGNKEVAVYLANKVKDLNVNGDYGTPLMAAVFRGHKDLAEVLLKLGADPNITDANGTSNLHYAVMLDNSNMVRLLLNNSADASIKDKKDRKPIDYAEIAHNKEIIKLLKNTEH